MPILGDYMNTSKIEVNSVGYTDMGLVRTNNEDSFYLNKLQNLFIVADGMGGHNAGEIASSRTIEIISEKFNKFFQEDKVYLKQIKKLSDKNLSTMENVVKELVIEANKEIYYDSLSNYETTGMGTTLELLTIDDENYYIAHVGDSRIYLLRKGRLTQITTDHSLVQELVDKNLLSPTDVKNNPYSHILTNALGIQPDFFMDIISEPYQDMDKILICSDGLTDMISDENIKFILSIPDLAIEKRAELLIDTAKRNDGLDNITLIILEINKIDD
jgi:protein phosphatase